jgi:hypothetical protein
MVCGRWAMVGLILFWLAMPSGLGVQIGPWGQEMLSPFQIDLNEFKYV